MIAGEPAYCGQGFAPGDIAVPAGCIFGIKEAPGAGFFRRAC